MPEWMQVRREAARSASGAMSAQANTCSPSANVEHVERMAFLFMSKSFGDLPQYHEQIRHWIYEPTSNQLLDSSWQPGAVHKLFEKELDNHHEERLLIAQLASQQLAQLLQEPNTMPFLGQHGEGLKPWVLRCLKVSLTEIHVMGRGYVLPSCSSNSKRGCLHHARLICSGTRYDSLKQGAPGCSQMRYICKGIRDCQPRSTQACCFWRGKQTRQCTALTEAMSQVALQDTVQAHSLTVTMCCAGLGSHEQLPG